MHEGDPDRPFWNPPAQTMDRDALRAVQDERLAEAVHRVYERTGRFRRAFDAAGAKPDDVRSVDDLGGVPIFAKAELRANEAERPPFGDYRAVGPEGCIRMATSTGTTGRPSYMLWTRHDLGVDYEIGARTMWRIGYRPGHVVVNTIPGYLNGGQAIISGIIEHMGCLSISIGPPDTDEDAERALRILEGIHVDQWRTLFTGALARLRAAAERVGYSGWLPELEEFGPLHQWAMISAGMECIGPLGSGCRPGGGAHIPEDLAILEALDPETHEPVPDGERGYMVCTSLGRDNPMLRYGFEDVIRVVRDPCDCGETTIRAFWDGRGADLVVVDGRWILPIDVWTRVPIEAMWAIVRTGREMDTLRVRIEDPDASSELAERLATELDVPVEVEAVPEGTLKRTAYKPALVLDEPAG